jgi:hypothetical protein
MESTHMDSNQTTGTPCDRCGKDIFPRVTTRELGAKCLTCCVGSLEMLERVMAERKPVTR